MGAIEDAIAAIDSREPGEDFTYQEYANRFNVNRTTLSRRHRGSQRPKSTKNSRQFKLDPQQERELVLYIEELTKQGLPPTREMIQNFAAKVAHQGLSEAWVTRFINRHSIHLISKWSTSMDRVRHQADSGYKYKLYFELLHGKIQEYRILPSNIYNMDEKGFCIGVIGRMKRVFSKRSWIKKEVKASIQDGNREWITVLAAVCADGSLLPPTLIYQAASGAIRDTWVDDITAGKHSVLVTSSPSGWTNNDIGLAWLEQVFDRYTKEKCRRSWRLLILDGHGSHLTQDFIQYCGQNKILLAIFPPHSTHTLQPLDVVMFKPLSSAYSGELARRQQRSLGSLHIKKGDFFPLFWAAWVSSFRKDNILKSFKATGIWPMDANVIIKRFNHTPEELDDDPGYLLQLSPADWNKMDRLIRAAVTDRGNAIAKRLSSTVHHLQVRNELLLYENEGLRDALHIKKGRKKQGKALDPQQRKEYHGGAVVWSPRKIEEARYREHIREKDEVEQHLKKLRRKKEREEPRILKQVQVEQQRQEREKAKAVRDQERAEKAAARAAKIHTQNTKKAIQKSQNGKRKASQATSSFNKRQKRVRGGGDIAEVQVVPLPAPAKVTSRGRNVNLPSKFR